MSITWLTSYPKSGNTWLRTFLTNYDPKRTEPASINELIGASITSDRHLFDEYVGLASADMTLEEIAEYRPIFCELLARDYTEPCFVKVHDAYTINNSGKACFPRQATAGVIYIIRNPLDVVVSYAHHENKTIDEIIKGMNCDRLSLAYSPRNIYSQLPQKLLSWHNHVISWVDNPELKVHVVRYEDMLARPVETFSNIVKFAGLALDANLLEKAIAFSHFDQLAAQEKKSGFTEKQPTALSFFRQGHVGAWQNHLSQHQINKIIKNHYKIMKRFNYQA